MRVKSSILIRLISIFIFIGVWQIIGMNMNPIFLSTPIAVARAFVELIIEGILSKALVSSIQVLTLGFLTACASGIPFGILIGRYKSVSDFFDLYIYIFYALPSIALLPLYIVWFGLGFTTKVVMVWFSAIFPILINTQAGVRDVESSLIEVARAFGATEREIMTKIVFPASVPFIVTGLRLGMGRALVGLIVAEQFTALAGLGELLVYYGNLFKTAYMLAPLVVIALLSVSLMYVLGLLEKRFYSWKIIRMV